MFGLHNKSQMVDAATALPGRSTEIPVPERHAVLGTSMKPPFPEGFEQLVVGMALEVLLLKAADDVGLPFWRPVVG